MNPIILALGITIAFMLLAIVLLIKFSVDINWENDKLRKKVKEIETSKQELIEANYRLIKK